LNCTAPAASWHPLTCRADPRTPPRPLRAHHRARPIRIPAHPAVGRVYAPHSRNVAASADDPIPPHVRIRYPQAADSLRRRGAGGRRRPCTQRPARRGRITAPSLAPHGQTMRPRNAQQSEQEIRSGHNTGSDLGFWWAGTGSNRRPCGFQSFGRVCSDAEIRCLRCSVGRWQGKPEQGLAGFSLTAHARWLVRTFLRPRRNRVAYCPGPDG
jgi:hypothetical protein